MLLRRIVAAASAARARALLAVRVRGHLRGAATSPARAQRAERDAAGLPGMTASATGVAEPRPLPVLSPADSPDDAVVRYDDAKHGFGQECHVLVVGSGAAGMSAALAAQRDNDRVWVFERDKRGGGASRASPGLVWLPSAARATPADAVGRLTATDAAHGRASLETPWHKPWRAMRAISADEFEAAERADAEAKAAVERREAELQALDARAAAETLPSVAARLFPRTFDAAHPTLGLDAADHAVLSAFCARSAEAVRYLEHLGMRFAVARGADGAPLPDLGADASAAHTLRAQRPRFERIAVEASRMWLADVGPMLRSLETLSPRISDLVATMTTPRVAAQMAQGDGWTLMNGLYAIAARRGMPIRVERRLRRVYIGGDEERIIGVTYDENNSVSFSVRTFRGLIMATGGFAKDDVLRAQLLGTERRIYGSAAPLGAVGDWVRIGRDIGARFSRTDEAWWCQTVLEPTVRERRPVYAPVLYQRGTSFFTVDLAGRRVFDDERAQSFVAHGRSHFSAPERALQIYVCDRHNIERHAGLYGGTFGPLPARGARGLSNWMLEADSVEALAEKVRDKLRALAVYTGGVELHADFGRNLAGTVTAYNDGQRGAPLDAWFGYARGAAAAGDSTDVGARRPLDTSGPLYATILAPSALDTRGGLATNEHFQVLREADGSPIRGLYAVGNSAAGFLGADGGYTSPGLSLGAALTSGYIAGTHVLTEKPYFNAKEREEVAEAEAAASEAQRNAKARRGWPWWKRAVM